MDKKLLGAIKVFGACFGMLVGLGLYVLINRLISEVGYAPLSTTLPTWINISILTVLSLIFGIIFYIFAPEAGEKVKELEHTLKSLPAESMLVGAIGLIVGLILAYLLVGLLDMLKISWITVPLSILLYALLGYLGIAVSLNKYQDLNFLDIFKKGNASAAKNAATGKVLDTSAIIDGRIYEIAKIGFIEGVIYVPQFVLTELRHIADSADELKRNRGRRGLDILKSMQNTSNIKVKIIDKDYEDGMEVDAKLIKLAAEIKAKVVTNDYNLNKVASVQGVEVLNVNELSNAVKPVALPGERMHVKIVKEGKEQQQGVAFLGDGTMIVVQEARERIGETLYVEVTSSLQTSAGRMIFARIMEDE
ncbi:MAG: PIN domain-containing protein [Eubacteriales bacterium]